MTPPCPGCHRSRMVADRYFSPDPDPLFFSDPPPPRPVWRCPACGMRIDREEVLPGLDFPVRGGTAPGSGQKPARRERG